MKIIDWSGLDAAGCREVLQRPTLRIADSVREGVQRIIAQVRADGDPALKALTRRFDGVELDNLRSEEHTSELQSLMRISYAVFCLKTKNYRIVTKKDIPNQ